MSDSKVVRFAKRIVNCNEYKPMPPDPNCKQCRGSGSVTHESGHNGDEFDMPCECLGRGRNTPSVLGALDPDVYMLAKAFLELQKKQAKAESSKG